MLLWSVMLVSPKHVLLSLYWWWLHRPTLSSLGELFAVLFYNSYKVCPSFSCPAFSTRHFVHHFPVLHFPPPDFSLSVIFLSCIFSQPHNSCGNRHWIRKQLHPDSIRDSIRIQIVATDAIRDSNKNFQFAGPQIRVWVRVSNKILSCHILLTCHCPRYLTHTTHTV